MFCPPRWSLLCGGPFEKGLLVRCYWKTLNSNSLDCFCAFTMSVIWSRNSFSRFSDSALSSFSIDFAWLGLFMGPASALSRLWYMVLLVCPTRNTVCWSKFSKSSVVKSASSWGTIVPHSRACHTFDRTHDVNILQNFLKCCLRYTPIFDYFLSEVGHKFIKFFYICNIRGNGVFGQDWLLQISFLYVLVEIRVGIFAIIWQAAFEVVVII